MLSAVPAASCRRTTPKRRPSRSSRNAPTACSCSVQPGVLSSRRASIFAGLRLGRKEKPAGKAGSPAGVEHRPETRPVAVPEHSLPGRFEETKVKQAKKHKEKFTWGKKRVRGMATIRNAVDQEAAPAAPAPPEGRVIRSRRYAVKPMSCKQVRNIIIIWCMTFRSTR